MIDLAPQIMESISEKDPLAFGNIVVSSESSHYTVTGLLHTSISKKDLNKLIQDIVKIEDPNRVVWMNLQLPERKLRVRTQKGKEVTEATNRRREKKPLDQLEVIYYGLVDTSIITPNEKFKKTNHETFQKVKNVIAVLGVISPIIVDKNYKIIDGNMRLEIAKTEGMEKVPVMVVNDEGLKADFLRMTINRSEEFQRWVYDQVDVYVDSVPQAQPLLEPLGFFGNKILPTSFFGKTVVGYELDDFNDQQKKYSQDIGLAKWAEMKRKEALKLEAKKLAKKNKKTETEGRVSLFDLVPQESDFIPTYDAPKEIRKNTLEMQDLAGKITEAFDAKRNAEIEAKGLDWQNTRMTSQQLADKKRAAAVEEAKTKKSTKAPKR